MDKAPEFLIGELRGELKGIAQRIEDLNEGVMAAIKVHDELDEQRFKATFRASDDAQRRMSAYEKLIAEVKGGTRVLGKVLTIALSIVSFLTAFVILPGSVWVGHWMYSFDRIVTEHDKAIKNSPTYNPQILEDLQKQSKENGEGLAAFKEEVTGRMDDQNKKIDAVIAQMKSTSNTIHQATSSVKQASSSVKQAADSVKRSAEKVSRPTQYKYIPSPPASAPSTTKGGPIFRWLHP